MTQMLTKQGSSLVVVLDPALVEELQLDATTPLEVKAEGGRIIITPRPKNSDGKANGEVDDATFDAAVAEVTARYQKTFKRLAE